MLFSRAVYSLHLRDRHFFNYDDRLDLLLDADKIFHIWRCTVLPPQIISYVKKKCVFFSKSHI